MKTINFSDNRFNILIEVVPPAGPDGGPLMHLLKSISGLSFDAFSVATNPVAKPRMSAMATCALAQQETDKPAILHCTTRDHNRIGLQGILWGAQALGIKTVLVATGDMVALQNRNITTRVRDMDVFGLVGMARQSGLQTGVVIDPHPEANGFETAIRRLTQKIDAGAQFAVTQPIYDAETADTMAQATQSMGIPVIMGILPLRTARHAGFLHQKVAGIAVPKRLRKQIQQADDTIKTGNQNAREMLAAARERFAGACIMPPFDHYEVLEDILDFDTI
ncbi:MAG: homocysteine methyltransferase [Deltaproteobacteria bacterium]|nr:MAG: homocysteine methyltransferase [Deltaproteobacteria bacterium]RLC09117.1 MAG: homocysteine methyltransferase [Deltaproteobacteria bacterium]